jgi:hypothetical protein
MCNFFSGIITEKDGILWHRDMDSHEEILDYWRGKEEKHKIMLRNISSEPQYVKFEILPQDSLWNFNLATWKFKVDQDILPDWYSENPEYFKEKAFNALVDCIGKIFIMSKKDKKIENSQGRWFIKSSNVTFDCYDYTNVTFEAYESFVKFTSYKNSTVEFTAYKNSRIIFDTLGRSNVTFKTYESTVNFTSYGESKIKFEANKNSIINFGATDSSVIKIIAPDDFSNTISFRACHCSIINIVARHIAQRYDGLKELFEMIIFDTAVIISYITEEIFYCRDFKTKEIKKANEYQSTSKIL